MIFHLDFKFKNQYRSEYPEFDRIGSQKESRNPRNFGGSNSEQDLNLIFNEIGSQNQIKKRPDLLRNSKIMNKIEEINEKSIY